MANSGQFAARTIGTVSNTAVSSVSVQRRGSAVIRKIAATVGKLAITLGVGLVVGGAVMFHVTKAESDTFSRRGGFAWGQISEADRVNAIAKWEMDIFFNGGAGIVAGATASSIMGLMLFSSGAVNPADEDKLRRQVVADELDKLIKGTSDESLIEAISTVQAITEDVA